jgi:glutamine synthetase
MIMTASLRYQKEVGESVATAKAAGANSPAGIETLSAIVSAISDFVAATTKLEKAVNHHDGAGAGGDAFAHAKYTKEQIVPAMAELRKSGDKLETIVSDDLWPLPTYREMLFIK